MTKRKNKPEIARAEPLADYIDRVYGGNRTEFAGSISPPTTKQHVNKWLNLNYIVVDGQIYSPRRPLHAEQ